MINFMFISQSGMTPLLHAAFRDRPDIAKLLLAHGADVNTNNHENGYTALMFAALSGRYRLVPKFFDNTELL